MKNYRIYIAHAAERDIINAADYIEFVLKNPLAAQALLDEAESKINALADFPEKLPIVDDSVLKTWGIRFVSVKNYLAFYLISEKDSTVYIVRFLFGKSDWLSVLKQEISLE